MKDNRNERQQKEVFTLQIERMDEYGEYEVVDEMKYAKIYYSFDDAVEDAKKAYDEYSAIEDKPVSVSIMGGEYEMPNGDIYGEPECLETIRDKNRDKFNESTKRKTTMKKLNITKERFEKSRYFTKKYGKLEYVSESGNLYKTDKGKVLMFNENIHRPDVEDLDVPVTKEEEVLAKYIEQCIKEELGIYSSCSTHNPGEEMHIEIFIGEDEYGEDTDLNELCDDLENCVNQIGKQEKYDSGTEWGDARFSPQGDYIYGEVWPLEGEYAINPKSGLTRESTKKFGRKFNESDAVQDAYDKYRACRTEPKVCHAIKVNDDGTEQKTSIWMDRGNSIGGIVKAIQDGRLRKVLKFSESSKQKFTKESIDADPALVCPYCGGNNCEVSIGTDDLNFTNLDRLQGETFNVECWCNDCNKPYNVTVELNVKDVYPNEDFENLEIELPDSELEDDAL